MIEDQRTRGHVRALDGVRALAVSTVFLFHLRVPGFRAGFLGVDVFFVLSGFLITTLLLDEAERTGRISLPSFWARRARRLLPALVLVLVALAAASWLTATSAERYSLRGDLLATTGYVANWHFISTSSYFADAGIESPLQHTWSLAIEEQFYVIWPLLVSGLLVAWRRSRTAVGVLSAVGTAASVALLALLWSPGSVERAYMGTDARIFQPLVGALGAVLVASPRVRGSLERIGTWLVVAGAIGLAGAMATTDPTGRGYFFGGAFFVAAMSLLLVAPLWVGKGGSLRRALEWSPVAWIGLVSYGVYLWHWPVVLTLGVRDASGVGLAIRGACAVAVTVGIAALSFYAIERPIRRGRLTGRHQLRSQTARHRWTLAAVPVALLATAGVSLAATHVPQPRSESIVIMLVGDSVPYRLQVAFERTAATFDWRVVSAAHGACPVTGERPTRPDGGLEPQADRCPGVIEEQDELIATTDPDVVLWWDRISNTAFRTDAGEHVLPGTPRFWDVRATALRRGVDRLSSHGAIVAFVETEPPGAAALTFCADPANDDIRCDRKLYQIDAFAEVTTGWNELMRRFAEDHPDRTAFLSVTDTICRTLAAPCDDDIAGVPARPDGTHYEGAGEKRVIAALVRGLSPLVTDAGPDERAASNPVPGAARGTSVSGIMAGLRASIQEVADVIRRFARDLDLGGSPQS